MELNNRCDKLAENYINMFSILSTGKMDVKTRWDFILPQSTWLRLNNDSKYWHGCRKGEPLFTAGGNAS